MHDIYLEMKDRIFTFILLHVGKQNKQLAEDILHETFIAVYDSAKNFKSFTNPRAWLLTIARNKAVSQIRMLSKTVNMEDEFFDSAAFSTPFIDETDTESLLSCLSEKDKEIVLLHVIYGFKHREIAKLTSQPLGTVTWRYKRSLDAMRKNLTQNDNCNKCNIESEVENI
jgi:RNA polymerase sigma-70 factor (ECF subfamily)